MMRRNLGRSIMVVLLFAVASPLLAEEGQLTVSAGVDYSSGEYYDENNDKTKVLAVPLSLKYERGDWIGRVTVPYLRIDGPGVPQDGQVVGGEESGIGDVVTSLSYMIFFENPQLPLVELTGKVKIPTADEDRGLGTGKTDYAGQVDLAKTFGNLTPFGTVGYKFRGGDLDDGVYASFGLGYKFSQSLSFGLIYDYQQAAVGDVFTSDVLIPVTQEDTDNSHELVPYFNVSLTDTTRLQTYGVVGLSKNSPDFGVGTSVSVDF